MSLPAVDTADLGAATTPARVVQANLFGSYSATVPSSPSDLGVDVKELIANLRQELEDKYPKQIQELKIIIANLNGNPNLKTMTADNPVANF